MYSQRLFEQMERLARSCECDPHRVTFLSDVMCCYLRLFAYMINASTTLAAEMLKIRIQLFLLDDGFAEFAVTDPAAEAAHYLIGLGYEQSGVFAARQQRDLPEHPLESDAWYCMVLATLHYLAGGHRVHALNPLGHLLRLGDRSLPTGTRQTSDYSAAAACLQRLYSGSSEASSSDYWARLFAASVEPTNTAERRIMRLVHRIRQRQDIVLRDLGRGAEEEWLAVRGIGDAASTEFWQRYLGRLATRRITTFTQEQVGPGFGEWLRRDRHLLVVLPTGSGKTIIGELATALCLAEGKQAIWMLPTRALVRQTKRVLREAFTPLGREVAELPVTEDPVPQFAEAFDSSTSIAVTTPERMAALLRGHPEAASAVGLVVLDEAHILLKETRADAAEMALRSIVDVVPDASVVLMTASAGAQEPLARLLEALGKAPTMLSSVSRPTRQTNGVIARECDTRNGYPCILIYPPGLHDGIAPVPTPFRLDLPHARLTKNGGSAELASRAVRQWGQAPLNTVVFVQMKASTETQAVEISKGQRQRELPQQDVARLHTELATDSLIEATAVRGVVPHHGSLARLEQHMVEKWLRVGLVQTVVATSTLAEGINLPFDISVLTFTQRYDQVTGRQEGLEQDVILNMLGRAGRAGYVADGICLIADRRTGEPAAVYQSRRSTFFKGPSATSDCLGVAKLLQNAVSAGAGRAEWLTSLSGMPLARAQSLVASVARALTPDDHPRSALKAYFARFPTVSSMLEDQVSEALETLVQLGTNIASATKGDQVLLDLLARTGLPLSALAAMRDCVVASATPDELGVFAWADEMVTGALEPCEKLPWIRDLVGRRATELCLADAFRLVGAWRSGQPLRSVLDGVPGRVVNRTLRHHIMEFLNHGISLLSQFWGALAVCAEMTGKVTEGSVLSDLRRMPAFIREGAAYIPELVWLRELGGLDRVLAARLAELGDTFSSYRAQQNYVRSQLRQYYHSPSTIPDRLTHSERLAVEGAVEELHRHE